MSTIDPDSRDRRVSEMLRPISRVLVVVAPLIPAAYALLAARARLHSDSGGALLFYFAWIVVAVGIGILALATRAHRSAALVVAYVFACAGGGLLVLFPSPPPEVAVVAWIGWIAGMTAAVAAIVVHLLRGAAVAATRAHGITVPGTIQSVGVAGMRNWVPRYRLTIRYTDAEEVERWIRVNRVGGSWNIGDPVSVRYNPARPAAHASIFVEP